MRLSVGHFDFILVGVLSLLNICAYFLPQIWGIFSYYFLNKLSAPVSLSSPSDTAMIQILIYLMVSHKSLRLSSCLYFFFLFVLWPDHFKWPVFKFTDSFFCLIRSALDSPLVKFSVQLSYSSVLTGSSSYFLSLCWSSHWVHPFFSQWALLWLFLWTFYLGKLPICFI